MAISWTHTVEDRLVRLERHQDRLTHKITALAKTIARQEAQTVPVSPAADVTPAATAPAPADPPVITPLAAPIGGGQALGTAGLSMWKPTARHAVSTRGNARILQRVQVLNQSVRNLSHTVQRLETICHLLGQCLTVAVDPHSHPAIHTGGRSGGEPELFRDPDSREDGVQEGGGDGGGLMSALTDLLPAVMQAQAPPAGEGDGDGGGSGLGGQNLIALLGPLLQMMATRSSGSGGGTRLASILGSPAFQQLLGMAGR